MAASAGMVLARPESPLTRRHDVQSSTPSPLTSRYSVSPSSSRDHSPYVTNRASLSPPNGASPTTGWINNSPQKKSSPPREREGTPFSTDSLSPPTSSGKKPHKLKRRKSSKPTPPLFGWRSKSKSPPPVEEEPASPVTIHHEEHYHLYDIGPPVTSRASSNPRQSMVSINSISPQAPRTPLKRIYPPPQKKDSPRLISPNSLCQIQTCNGTPVKEKEQLLIKTLRRMTSDTNLSPTRSPGHKRNQSVPSFDSGKPKSPSPEPHADTNAWTYKTPVRSSAEKTVWLVSDDNTPHDEKFASQARRKLEFDTRRTSNSSFTGRLSSQSPPPVIPERCDSLNWDSDSDPTYESMKTDPEMRQKTRLSSVFDETELNLADIPEHKSPRTVVRILSRDEEEELDWGDAFSISKGHPNITRRLPKTNEVDALNIPGRTTSLSRSKSVPPSRPDISPQKSIKRMSGTLLSSPFLTLAPKECWDNDFDDEGADMWIPSNITDAQDKLKGYLASIKTFSALIDELKRFRQRHPRTHKRPTSQEQLLDEIDGMIEISTLDGFTPPPYNGPPPPSPKKSTASLASSQWSFEDRFAAVSIDDDRMSIPTPPPAQVLDSAAFNPKDLQARRLLEKILGESDDLRMEVKPEQLTKMIEYVTGLRSRCEEFELVQGTNGTSMDNRFESMYV